VGRVVVGAAQAAAEIAADVGVARHPKPFGIAQSRVLRARLRKIGYTFQVTQPAFVTV